MIIPIFINRPCDCDDDEGYSPKFHGKSTRYYQHWFRRFLYFFLIILGLLMCISIFAQLIWITKLDISFYWKVLIGVATPVSGIMIVFSTDLNLSPKYDKKRIEHTKKWLDDDKTYQGPKIPKGYIKVKEETW